MKASSLKATCDYLYLHDNCAVDMADGSTITNFLCSDSKITKSSAWDICPLVSAYRCEWAVPMQPATDNVTDCALASFSGCLLRDVTIKHKHLSIVDCFVNNCVVEVYPYMDGATDKVSFVMDRSTYNSSTPLYIGRYIDNTDATGKNVVPSISITNNNFLGNEKGIVMPFYALIANKSLFLAGGSMGGIVYQGNSGLCPKDSAQGAHDTWSATTAYDTDLSNSGYVSSREIRAFPLQSTKTAMTTLAFNRWTQEYTLTNYGQDISADGKTGAHIVHSVQLTPWNDEDNNDFFSLRYYAGSNPNKTIVIM